tara:strand:+ start:21474 stop:22037 length:564 start_codon:yes stop_codon:yes gene_type:complete
MKKLIVALVLLFIGNSLSAQTNYTLNNSKSTLTIEGTSTIHDWESEAEKVTGEAVLELSDNELINISSLAFKVEVKSIKSGKRIMDSKTKDALKEKSNPEIIFKLDTIENLTADSVSAKGTLNIAGKTNEVILNAAYSIGPDGSISINGSQPIKMTDYNIDPPTAMMGTMKTGDDVTVIYNVLYTKN